MVRIRKVVDVDNIVVYMIKRAWWDADQGAGIVPYRLGAAGRDTSIGPYKAELLLLANV